jgi:hypothetical protein
MHNFSLPTREGVTGYLFLFYIVMPRPFVKTGAAPSGEYQELPEASG